MAPTQSRKKRLTSNTAAWRTFDKCGNRNKLRFCANLAGNILNLADPADRGLSIWLSARFSRHQVALGHRCDPRRGG